MNHGLITTALAAATLGIQTTNKMDTNNRQVIYVFPVFLVRRDVYGVAHKRLSKFDVF